MEVISALIICVLILAGYFFPAIVAVLRGHRQSLAIFMTTLFLGWSGLGWVGALIWACTADLKPKTDSK